jgi:hypothetical protein
MELKARQGRSLLTGAHCGPRIKKRMMVQMPFGLGCPGRPVSRKPLADIGRSSVAALISFDGRWRKRAWPPCQSDAPDAADLRRSGRWLADPFSEAGVKDVNEIDAQETLIAIWCDDPRALASPSKIAPAPEGASTYEA